MLVGSTKAEDVLDLQLAADGTATAGKSGATEFKPVTLSTEVSLRNLGIQEIKYATISDIILYAPVAKRGRLRRAENVTYLKGLAESVSQAQRLIAAKRERIAQCQNEIDRSIGRPPASWQDPVRYGVYIVTGMSRRRGRIKVPVWY
jgi:dual specificity MAP kinase phosphatase